MKGGLIIIVSGTIRQGGDGAIPLEIPIETAPNQLEQWSCPVNKRTISRRTGDDGEAHVQDANATRDDAGQDCAPPR